MRFTVSFRYPVDVWIPPFPSGGSGMPFPSGILSRFVKPVSFRGSSQFQKKFPSGGSGCRFLPVFFQCLDPTVSFRRLRVPFPSGIFLKVRQARFLPGFSSIQGSRPVPSIQSVSSSSRRFRSFLSGLRCLVCRVLVQVVWSVVFTAASSLRCVVSHADSIVTRVTRRLCWVVRA
jgi:hypothetical protein